MNPKRMLLFLLALMVFAGLAFNQWRLQRDLQRLRDGGERTLTTVFPGENADGKLRQAEMRYDEARAQLQIAEQKLADANTRLAAIDQRVRQLESSPQASIRLDSTRRLGQRTLTFTEEPQTQPGQKRGWGPEQVVGEPDTFQAGDISTAWAPREQDGGEEWLKLDYETSVDIAEVRVRETYNPGAISKVAAVLPNGSEVTLWEGIEPKSEAPVEMSFTVPASVNAKSVKVYLDTKRVPGWNEIDAVQLIGRDGSQQWAKQVTASSTYAEPRVAGQLGGLERF